MEFCNGENFTIEELLSFGNQVFGLEVQPGGFATLLPKLQNEEVEPKHYRVITEDGVIKAMLASVPLTMKAGRTLLQANYIGLVSVAEDARGKGYMKLLLNRTLAELSEKGIQLSILGGQRQRYGYFGYELGGIELRFCLNKTNIKHACQNIISEGIKVLSLENHTRSCEDAYQLYKSQTTGIVREQKHFYDSLCSWRSKPYELQYHGRFCGYFSMASENEAEKEFRVNEIYFDKGAPIQLAYKAIFEQLSVKEIEFFLPAYETSQIQVLADICESYEVGCNHLFHIFDFTSVLQAYFNVKAEQKALCDGRITVQIDEECILISVVNGVPTVRDSVQVKCSEEPLKLSRSQAVQLFFSPLGATSIFSYENQIPSNWCSLPLYLSLSDAC